MSSHENQTLRFGSGVRLATIAILLTAIGAVAVWYGFVFEVLIAANIIALLGVLSEQYHITR